MGKSKNQRGATLLEAAIGLPVCLALIFLFFAFGQYVYLSIAVSEALDSAERTALAAFARGAPQSQVNQAVNLAFNQRIKKFGVKAVAPRRRRIVTVVKTDDVISTSATMYTPTLLHPFGILNSDNRGLDELTRSSLIVF